MPMIHLEYPNAENIEGTSIEFIVPYVSDAYTLL